MAGRFGHLREIANGDKGAVVPVNGRYGIRIVDIAATETRMAGVERRG